MRRIASLFGAGVTVFFVMFSTGLTVDQARAADAPPAAPAADAPATPGQRAKQHYLQGEAYFKSRNFSDAIDEYQRGYFDKPDPVFIFNIAQCHRLLGHTAAAIEFYQRYLKEAPEGPGRPVAEKQIAELSAPPALPPAVEPPAPADVTAAPAPAAPLVPLPTAVPPAAPPPAPPAVATAPATPPAPPPAEPVTAAPLALPAAPPPATATAPASAPVLISAQAQPTERPVYERWYFWTAVAALVLGTIVVAAATSPDRPNCAAGRVCK